MDPATIALLANLGINVAGGIGGAIANAWNEPAASAEDEALRRLIFREAEQLGPEDPATVAAERQALERLMGLGTGGGLDAQAQARLMESNLQAAQQERSARGGILSREAQRGPISSGRALSAQLQAASNTADRQALAGTQAAADAESRALAALTGGAGLAGRMRERAEGRERFNIGQRDRARGGQAQYHQGKAAQLRGQAGAIGSQISDTAGAIAGGIGAYGNMLADEKRRRRAGPAYQLPYDTGRGY